MNMFENAPIVIIVISFLLGYWVISALITAFTRKRVPPPWESQQQTPPRENLPQHNIQPQTPPEEPYEDPEDDYPPNPQEDDPYRTR